MSWRIARMAVATMRHTRGGAGPNT